MVQLLHCGGRGGRRKRSMQYRSHQTYYPVGKTTTKYLNDDDGGNGSQLRSEQVLCTGRRQQVCKAGASRNASVKQSCASPRVVDEIMTGSAADESCWPKAPLSSWMFRRRQRRGAWASRLEGGHISKNGQNANDVGSKSQETDVNCLERSRSCH